MAECDHIAGKYFTKTQYENPQNVSSIIKERAPSKI